MGEEEPQLASQLDPGTEGGDGLRVDVRHVDGVADLAMEKRGAHRLGDLDADEFLCFRSGRSEVRGEYQIRHVAVRPFGGEGFDLEDVESGASDLSALETLGKDILVNQAATGAVDDANPFLEKGKLLLADHVTRLVGEGHVNGDEVGLRQDVINLLHNLHLQ